VVRVRQLSDRRGPAPEARLLYDDLTPAPEADPAKLMPRQGRPSREDRRIGRLSKEGPLE
jgi:ribosome-associated heat shock protein Hsp15